MGWRGTGMGVKDNRNYPKPLGLYFRGCRGLCFLWRWWRWLCWWWWQWRNRPTDSRCPWLVHVATRGILLLTLIYIDMPPDLTILQIDIMYYEFRLNTILYNLYICGKMWAHSRIDWIELLENVYLGRAVFAGRTLARHNIFVRYL